MIVYHHDCLVYHHDCQFNLGYTCATILSVSLAGLQINKVFQQFVKRVQQDVWERDFG